jgi:hypothetical protein
LLWAAEQKYLGTRQKRDTEGLIALVHDRVTAWPHIAPAPMDSVHFREDARTRGKRDSIAAYELSFTPSRSTATHRLLYRRNYQQHYTTQCGATGQKASVHHADTWIRDPGAWRFAGGMSRPAGRSSQKPILVAAPDAPPTRCR